MPDPVVHSTTKSTGGTGDQVLAKDTRDTRLDRPVAIKILPPQFADPEHRARFQREARTIATLSHPHICTLHDVGEHGSSLFLVMEYLLGETLAEQLRRGALPLEQALEVGAQIAEALSAAHRAGIVHRDLKPGNIMLTKGGVKLLDFGLAKLRRPTPFATAATAAMPTQSEPLTGRGTIVGTLQYMAPEQLEGKDADARADIWALGCVLYEMTSGERAFEGKSEASLIAAIIGSDPRSLRSIQPLTPAALDDTVQECLIKDPEDRWQSARDLERELRRISEQITPEPRNGRRSRGRWAASAVTLIVLGAAAGAFLTRRATPIPLSRPAEMAHFLVALPPGDTLDPGLRPALALAPDGSKLVYSATRAGTPHLFVRRLDRLDPILLPGTDGASGPFFSPDGQFVGFFASGKLMKAAVDGGVPVAISEAPSGRGAAWGDDGNILFTAAPGTGLSKVPAAGGMTTVVTRLSVTGTERTHRWPEMLSGSNAALITVRGSEHVSFDKTSIVLLSLASGQLSPVLAQGTQPRYARTGHLIFARAGALQAVVFNPITLTVSGPPVAVLDDVTSDPSTGAAHYTLSDNGILAYLSGPEWVSQREVLWVEQKGLPSPLLDRSLTYATPRFTPAGGGRLAVVVEGPSDNIWVAHAGSQTPSRVTFETGSHVAPVWTPDGERIVFASNTYGAYNLFWKRADGSDTAERLTESAQIQFPGSWSPDGRLLVFTESDPATGSDISLLSLGDRTTRAVVRTRFNEHGPALSPDGHWLAYCSDESGQEEVYVQPFPGPGEKRQVSVDGGREPVWSRRGDALFYRSANRFMVVAVSAGQTFSATRATSVLEGDYVRSPIGGVPSYDVSPDGRRLLLTRENRQGAPSSIHVILNWFEVLMAKLPAK